MGREYFEMDRKYIGWEARNELNLLRKDVSNRPLSTVLTFCPCNLNPYCLGRKAAFFSVGI
jgi:hypothetical protein